jgi:hypothetical protein
MTLALLDITHKLQTQNKLFSMCVCVCKFLLSVHKCSVSVSLPKHFTNLIKTLSDFRTQKTKYCYNYIHPKTFYYQQCNTSVHLGCILQFCRLNSFHVKTEFAGNIKQAGTTDKAVYFKFMIVKLYNKNKTCNHNSYNF